MTNTPFRIAFLIFPGMTQLDLTGPAQILHRMPDTEVDYLWTSMDPVMTDSQFAIVPTSTIDNGVQYDMLCIPGGHSATDMMQNEAVLNWLRQQEPSAELVTSVCSGSLILAAAGLLDGYKASTHWHWMDGLEKFGAIPTNERVVVDRNRITAGGVTSGIDFGFSIIEQKHGKDFAEMLVLGFEYDPAPSSGGTPKTARPEIVEAITAFLKPKTLERQAIIDKVAEKYQATRAS